MKHIFWISSYPKSGNTLMRAILVSLFFTNNGKFKFEDLNLIHLFEHTQKLEYIKKEYPEDFKKLEDLNIVSKYFLKLQTKEKLKLKADFCFLKTHSAQLAYFNKPFTTQEYSKGVIYIVRDPRDVAISYSKHFNKNLDEQIDFMTNNSSTISFLQNSKNENIKAFVPLSRWDIHIKSWQAFNIPKIIIKYEDLINKKKDIIFLIINFFEKNYGFKFDNIEEKIKNIILTTEFKKMQNHERIHKFIETSEHSNFFRSGKQNQWQNILNKKQISLIEKNFKNEMKMFGYI